MCRTVRRLMNTVGREGGQPILRGEPTRLLSNIGRQDEERLSPEALKGLDLVKHGSQLGELVAVGTQFARRRGERPSLPLGIGGQRSGPDHARHPRDARTRQRRQQRRSATPQRVEARVPRQIELVRGGRVDQRDGRKAETRRGGRSRSLFTRRRIKRLQDAS